MKMFKPKKVKVSVQDEAKCRLPRARTSSSVAKKQEQKILQVLGKEKLTVKQIARLTRLPVATLRVRLRALRADRRVKMHFAGPMTKYSRR